MVLPYSRYKKILLKQKSFVKTSINPISNQAIYFNILPFKVSEVPDPAKLYDQLMKLLVKFADHGVIHGDFNEFNIMLGKYGIKT